MTHSEFKERIFGCARQLGFTESGKTMRRDGEGVTILIGIEKGFGNQWFINVGFNLTQLANHVPDSIERTHMYFRCERLFPQLRDVVLAAGDFSGADQEEAFRAFLSAIPEKIDPELRLMGSLEGLQAASKRGLLNAGLVTKEARQLLDAP